MNTKFPDVVIHTKHHLNEREFADLSRQVYRKEGVISFNRRKQTPQLVIAVYNADRIRSDSILGAVIRAGHDAALVGM